MSKQNQNSNNILNGNLCYDLLGLFVTIDFVQTADLKIMDVKVLFCMFGVLGRTE